jgi:hypothetical protein
LEVIRARIDRGEDCLVQLAETQDNYSVAVAECGDSNAAAILGETAVRLWRQVVAQESKWLFALARALANLSTCYRDAAQAEKAVAVAAEALSVYDAFDAALIASHWDEYRAALHAYATALTAAGEARHASEVFLQIAPLDIGIRAIGPRPCSHCGEEAPAFRVAVPGFIHPLYPSDAMRKVLNWRLIGSVDYLLWHHACAAYESGGRPYWPDGAWWACAEPEREPDALVHFDFSCAACALRWRETRPPLPPS